MSRIIELQTRYNELNKKYRANRFFPEQRAVIDKQLQEIALEILNLKREENTLCT